MPPVKTFALLLLCSAGAEPSQIDPVPRPLLDPAIQQWTFDRGTEGWVAEHHCTVSADAGMLKIRVTGDDPYLHRRVNAPGGHVVLEIRARSSTTGNGSVYWTTADSPRRGEDKVKSFGLRHDGQWHDYSVPFLAPGTLLDLRIDPGQTPGNFEIDRIRLVTRKQHPLRVERVQIADGHVRFSVRNDGPEPIEFSALDRRYTVPGGASIDLDRPIRGETPLEALSIEIRAGRLPPVRRTVFLHHPEVQTDWIVRPLADFTLQVARDGSVARITRGGRIVAVLGPLVHFDGRLPELELVDQAPSLRFRAEGVSLDVATEGAECSVSIDAAEPCEGPVVRALGGLEQGLFAGLEYLGKAERSSSKLDVETEEHLRFAPDPLKVTMPLLAVLTDRASLAMTWTDMTLQPVFATPNFFDATNDHRMALRGTRIEATIRVDRAGLEEAIAWAVAKRGLPPLPDPPRSGKQQMDLCLAGLQGPLRTDEGWGHCVEPKWPRRPHADMASAVWRISGRVPDLPKLVPNGSHIPNDTIYFLTGRAAEWKEVRGREVRGVLSRQQPDGSFRYNGKYRRGHFEDTASGVCARPAARLLEYARITGDRTALEAGLRTLEFMKRFRTPRGAQVWEVPLHTPDLLASAYAVWAYVRGYELTGDEAYLREARKWALSGVPFVYLWSRYPVMLYATPPVYGATNWRAPCWIGLPVQWVGIVYAYSLAMLSPHDDSLDWDHLARGILISAEQMQYPDDPYAGLLPDAFDLAGQVRRPWTINPSSLISLRLVLDGQVDSLSVAADGAHRVAAPLPVTLQDGQARIKARPGLTYQVLIDGRRIVDVTSTGDDVIPLR